MAELRSLDLYITHSNYGLGESYRLKSLIRFIIYVLRILKNTFCIDLISTSSFLSYFHKMTHGLLKQLREHLLRNALNTSMNQHFLNSVMETFDKANSLERCLEIFVKKIYWVPPFKEIYLCHNYMPFMRKSLLVSLRTEVC